MTTENPVLSKIRKLLALADAARNSSEAEAQAAALKVQELLQDYGLSMAEVEASGGKSDDGGRENKGVDRRAMYQWQRSLMESLATNNFCLHRLRMVDAHDGVKQRRSKQHTLIGRQLNINVTVATYDYLSDAIRRAADAQGFDHATNESNRHLFLDGAVARLIERLKDQRLQREQAEAAAKEAARKAGGAGNALVLSDVYGTEADLNNDALDSFPPGTTAQRRRDRQDKEAARLTREKELVAGGMAKTEAFYVSHGYSAEQSKAYAQQWDRRQARDARRSSSTARGWTKGWTKADEKHHVKVSSPAYKAGRAAGDKVGLDTQVSSTSGPRRMK